ncbi:hypothetical protein REPUB_Repub09cG0168200 [Reevesia pubescens]
MESFDNERAEYLEQARESYKGSNIILEAEAELREMKEELKRAKDNATESWLESKPLIDELERLKSDLKTAQNQSSMSNNVILELESQLETIVKDIRSKREEELKATKMANELNPAVEQTREELERLKADKDEEHRTRSKLKQTLRLRRQTLRRLQLTLRAVRIESEAFGASAAEALRYINHQEPDNSPVQLTRDEYYALKRKAKEETSLADWRVSVAMEQKLTAEASRNLALTRLKETHPDNRTRREGNDKIVVHEETKQEEADQDLTKQGVDEVPNTNFAFPKARAKAIAQHKQGKQQWMSKSKGRKNKEFRTEKKVSILSQLKCCMCA